MKAASSHGIMQTKRKTSLEERSCDKGSYIGRFGNEYPIKGKYKLLRQIISRINKLMLHIACFFGVLV